MIQWQAETYFLNCYAISVQINMSILLGRWWVGSHAADHSTMSIGRQHLDQGQDSVQKIRAVLRFLLSSLGDYQPCQHSLPVQDLRPVDRYMLHLLHAHAEKVCSVSGKPLPSSLAHPWPEDLYVICPFHSHSQLRYLPLLLLLPNSVTLHTCSQILSSSHLLP